jgi:hypothetical protein
MAALGEPQREIYVEPLELPAPVMPEKIDIPTTLPSFLPTEVPALPILVPAGD